MYNSMIKARSYNQFCSLARALDLVGERWTLLLIRELIPGPRRFTDLLNGLKGIGTNLLSKRLKELESAGIIEQESSGASGREYRLTPVGRELEPALVELARWGTRYRNEFHPGDQFSARWNALAFKAVFNREAARGVNEIYEVRVDDDVLSIRVKDGQIETKEGTSWDPDLVFECDEETFIALAASEMTLEDATEQNKVRVDGTDEALRHFSRIFGSTEPGTT